jgi:hypothetical protein
MTSLDFLYFALGIGFLSLAGFVSYAAYQAALTLKAARRIIEDVEDTVLDFVMLKDGMKMGVLSVLTNLFRPRR